MKTISLLSTLLIAMITSISAAPKSVALDGYCPVCYIAAGKANKGSESYQTLHNGKTYYFVSEATKQMFITTPNKFLPQYDGYCAYGMSLGKKFESDPTVFKVIDNKLYLNKDAAIGKVFAKDTAGSIKKADAKWAMISKEAMAKKEAMMKK